VKSTTQAIREKALERGWQAELRRRSRIGPSHPWGSFGGTGLVPSGGCGTPCGCSVDSQPVKRICQPPPRAL